MSSGFPGGGDDVNIRVILDVAGVVSGARTAQQSIKGIEGSSAHLAAQTTHDFQKIRDELGNIGVKAIGAGAILAVGLGAATKAASDLNESASKSAVVFGKANDSIVAFANGAAKSLGISKQEAFEATSTFGNLFRGIGLAQRPAAQMSTTIVKLASDLASFNNQDPSQVLDDLRSGLVGEAEPLRKYGVLLNEASVQQEAMAESGKTNAAELTEGEKAAARYQLILQQTTTAQGDFARTQDGVANSSRIASASIKDAEAAIGTALLPTVASAAKGVAVLAEGIASLPPGLLQVAGEAAGAAAAILLVAGAAAKTVSVVGNTIAGVRDLGDLLRGIKGTGTAAAQGVSAAATAASAAELAAAEAVATAAIGEEAAAAGVAATANAELAVSQVAAAASSEALAVGAVSAAEGLGAAAIATGATEAAAVGAELASAGLLATLGPIGLVAAAAAAAFGIFKLIEGHHDEATAAKDADQATQGLIDTLHRLNAEGSPFAGIATSFADTIDAAFAKIPQLKADIESQIGALNTVTGGTPEAIDPTSDLGQKLAELQADEAALTEAAGQTSDAHKALADVFNDTGTGAKLAQDATRALFDQYAQDGDVKALFDGIIAIDNSLGDYDVKANAAAEAARQFAIAQTGASDGIDVLKTAVDGLTLGLAETARGQQVLADLQEIAAHGTVSQRTAVQSLFALVQTGGATYDTFAKFVRRTAAAMDAETAAAKAQLVATEDAIVAHDRDTASLEAHFQASLKAEVGVNDLAHAQRDALIQTADLTAANTENAFSLKTVFDASLKTADSIAAETTAKEDALIQTAELTAANTENAFSLGTVFEQSLKTAAGFEEDRQKAIDAAHAIDDFAHALGVFDSLAEQLRPIDLRVRGGDRATGTAAELERTAAGLDSVLGEFRTIEDLGQRQEQAGSIVDKLVGKPGEWATIDDLLKEGRISRTRYNETVEAGIDIQNRNAEVQRDLQTIEAKQLPILDAADAAYARYIDKVSHLSPTQQTAALGFLDANEAMKAQQAIALAAAAANGELGDQGKEAAQKIIEGAIAADPVLTAMLKELGLVSIDREGNVRIHFPDAKSLHDDLSLIKDDLDALIKLLGGVPPDVKSKVKVTTEGKQEAEDTVGLVEGAHGKVGHMRVEADTSPADAAIDGTKRHAEQTPIVIPVSIATAVGTAAAPDLGKGDKAETPAPVVAPIVTPAADTSLTIKSFDDMTADAGTKGVEAGEASGSGVVQGLDDQRPHVRAAADATVSDIAAAGEGTYAAGYNAGLAYDVGAIDGINALAAAVAQAAANVATAVDAASRAALGAHSPSRKAMDLADDWANGWILQLARRQQDVSNASASLFDLRAARSVGFSDPSTFRAIGDAQRPALPAAPVVVRGGHSFGDLRFDVNVNGTGLDTDAIVQRINTETVDAIYGLINRRL